jgi:phosphate/phosphite/phosphonate ABC transporter binding protein
VGQPRGNNSRARTLRVGIALGSKARARGSSHEAELRGRLDSFCDALSGATSLAVPGSIVLDYPALLGDMRDGVVDLGWLPPIVALKAFDVRRAQPLALPVRNGHAVYHTALFAREGSPLRSTEDLVGVRAAWVDPFSASGYLVIRAALRSRGVDVERAFSRQTFVDSHERVVEEVACGRADVAATFVHYDATGDIVRAGWDSEPMQVVTSFGPIPSDMIAASLHAPVWTVERAKDALLGAGNAVLAQATNELLEAEGLVGASDTIMPGPR